MKSIRLLVLGGLMIASSSLAGEALTGVCEVDFRAKATMDRFGGKVKSELASVDLAQDKFLTFTVGIAQMQTGNPKRDAAMYAMFSATNFPLIVGATPTAALNGLDPTSTQLELPIAVTMHGITQSFLAQVSNLDRTATNLVFDAAFTVALRDFGLKPPTMMKLIRVNNRVQVVAHVALAK